MASRFRDAAEVCDAIERSDSDSEEAMKTDPEDDASDSDDDYFYENPPLVTLSLKSLSAFGACSQVDAKTKLLTPHLLRQVRKMTHLNCEQDPVWAHQLLYDASQHLEELQVRAPARRHLEVLEQMPHLMRLCVDYFNEERNRGVTHLDHMDHLLEQPYAFSKPLARFRGLRFIKVGFWPKSMTFSLLRAHRLSLEEVWLTVGTWFGLTPVAAARAAGTEAEAEAVVGSEWPNTCGDLTEEFGLGHGAWPRLRRIVLTRWLYQHDKFSCYDQVTELREILIGTTVQCSQCDQLDSLDF